MAQLRNNLQQTAMLYGTYKGVFWIAKFALFPLGFIFSPFALFFILLTLVVPIIVFIMVRSFRERQCGGILPFFPALAFSFQVYLFAAILTSVAHYIYFQFLDNGFIYNQVLTMLEQFNTDQSVNAQTEQLKHVVEVLYGLTPIQLTMQLLSQNIFYAIIFSLPIALVVMRKKVR